MVQEARRQIRWGTFQKSKKERTRIYTWQCGYCGISFETTHYGKRYCSPRCKERAYRLRKYEREKAEKQAVEAKV